jgi:hypothetical protein
MKAVVVTDEATGTAGMMHTRKRCVADRAGAGLNSDGRGVPSGPNLGRCLSRASVVLRAAITGGPEANRPSTGHSLTWLAWLAQV